MVVEFLLLGVMRLSVDIDELFVLRERICSGFLSLLFGVIALLS